MIAFRGETAARLEIELLVYVNEVAFVAGYED